MDTMSIILIIVVIALLVFFMNRSRTIARGSNRPTYDDPDYRSGGSIGGASGGASGGARPTHDSPDYRSGDSIGGSGGTTSTTSHRKDTGNASVQRSRNDD